MAKKSAGLLLFRRPGGRIEVLLVHPGGPFFARKDAGAWTVPKGEIQSGEDGLDCARREFREETGATPQGAAIPLGNVRQAGGKTVEVWAIEGDFDTRCLVSNRFELEWPPRSGRRVSFPEVDRAEWFSIEGGREKINPAQKEFLDRLMSLVYPG